MADLQFCFKGVDASKETCIDLLEMEKLSHSEYTDWLNEIASNPYNPSYLTNTRLDENGDECIDIYRAFIDGKPFDAEAFAKLNGQLPFLWRGYELESARIGDNALSPNLNVTDTSLEISLIASDDTVLNLILEASLHHKFELMYSSLADFSDYTAEITKLIEDYEKEYLEFKRKSKEKVNPDSRDSEDVSHSENDRNNKTPPEEQIVKLHKVYDEFGFSEEERLPLFVSSSVEHMESVALYQGISAYDISQSGNARRISVKEILIGDTHLKNPDDKQYRTLAHEIGHQRWFGEYEKKITDPTLLVTISYFLIKYWYDPAVLDDFLSMITLRDFQGRYSEAPESEIYSELFATEFETRNQWFENSHAISDSWYALENLKDIIKWPEINSVDTLMYLLFLANTDPMLSDASKQELCVFLEKNIPDKLWDKVQEKYNQLLNPKIYELAGVEVFYCEDKPKPAKSIWENAKEYLGL